MPEQKNQNGAKPQEAPEGITKITVGGYKSIAQEQSVEIRPLTILAGANSSGKSSIMQPLLLMKQTIQALYDPGALLLDGPNVQFSSAKQLLSRLSNGPNQNSFTAGFSTNRTLPVKLTYTKEDDYRLGIAEMAIGNSEENRFYLGMSYNDILAMPLFHMRLELAKAFAERKFQLSIVRNRCVLDIGLKPEGLNGNPADEEGSKTLFSVFLSILLGINNPIITPIPASIYEIIHLPGLRGNPARTYPVAAFGSPFPGTFENYTASVIAYWQSTHQTSLLEDLKKQMADLGLTNSVAAEATNATQLELRVGRTLQSNVSDTVSIADVGIGVSQTLPVLVALLAAKPGQLVYLEQPEIHLHPRAQTVMAQVLADAAIRGVRVVAETHSSLLLLGIQTLVAEGRLPPNLVKLHWFTRGEKGETTIQSADLDESGAFGDWPEDFDDVTLNAQGRYLDAAEQRMVGK